MEIKNYPKGVLPTGEGQLALLDMHNDPQFAVEQCLGVRGMMVCTTQGSYDGFVAKATDEQKEQLAKWQGTLHVLADPF